MGWTRVRMRSDLAAALIWGGIFVLLGVQIYILHYMGIRTLSLLDFSILMAIASIMIVSGYIVNYRTGKRMKEIEDQFVNERMGK